MIDKMIEKTHMHLPFSVVFRWDCRGCPGSPGHGLQSLPVESAHVGDFGRVSLQAAKRITRPLQSISTWMRRRPILRMVPYNPVAQPGPVQGRGRGDQEFERAATAEPADVDEAARDIHALDPATVDRVSLAANDVSAFNEEELHTIPVANAIMARAMSMTTAAAANAKVFLVKSIRGDGVSDAGSPSQ